MTLNQLHKRLGKLIEKGHGREHVGIDKETFRHPLECDGGMVLLVDSLETRWVPLADDDGGQAVTKAGVERGSSMAVLYGNSRERLTRRNADIFRESGGKELGWCANCRKGIDNHHGKERWCAHRDSGGQS